MPETWTLRPEKKDETDPVAWTSVGKSGPSQINTWVKIHVPSATYAPWFTLQVADDSASFITVTPSTPLSGADTDIEIRGIAGDDAIKEATVELRVVDTGQVACRLKVKVLPPRGPIGVSFYVVRNSTDVNYQFSSQNPGGIDPQAPPHAYNYLMGSARGVANPAAVIDEINQRMKACAVTVALATNNGTGEKLILFDKAQPRNYKMDSTKEFKYLSDNANNYAGNCVFLYLPSIQYSNNQGVGGFQARGTRFIVMDVNGYIANANNPSAQTEDTFGVIDSMKRSTAHEFGHYLTMARATVHDKRPFPAGTRPLMRSGAAYPNHEAGPPGRWSRHEDWEAANNAAKLRMNGDYK